MLEIGHLHQRLRPGRVEAREQLTRVVQAAANRLERQIFEPHVLPGASSKAITCASIDYKMSPGCSEETTEVPDRACVRGMRLRGALAALTSALACLGANGANIVDKSNHAAATDDPYLWLEDIHGAKPMEWVKAQNAKSTAVLQADPDYPKDYDAILKVLDATDRIPYGELDHQYVTNFWQDAPIPRASGGAPAGRLRQGRADWDILLDLDKLAADEHENWVWKGAECTPSCSAACSTSRAVAGMRWWCASSIRGSDS